MKVAIVNLGQIVSGDWRNPFVAGDTIVMRGRAHRLGRHRVGAGGRRGRRGDRRRRHDGDPGPDRFPRPHHLRRLHAAPAHGRLSRKLPAWRDDDRDLGLRGARSGAAEGRRGRKGTGGRGAALLCRLAARRHARDRRLGDPGARPARRRLRGAVPARACDWRRPASARSRRPTTMFRWWPTPRRRACSRPATPAARRSPGQARSPAIIC